MAIVSLYLVTDSPGVMKTVPSVYAVLMNSIYLSHSTQVYIAGEPFQETLKCQPKCNVFSRDQNLGRDLSLSFDLSLSLVLSLSLALARLKPE